MAATFSGFVPHLCGQAPTFARLVEQYEAALADRSGAAAVTEEFLPRFQATAEAHEGKESAAPFLVWILEHAGLSQDVVEPALESLLEGPVDQASQLAAARRLPYLYAVLGPETVDDALEILADSKHEEVRARALFSMAMVETTEWGRRSAAGQRRAITDLREAVVRSSNSVLRARAAELKVEGRGVAVGDLAPEILGLDMDGAPFKLSDYRGKVVVLDFWGDW